MTIATRRNTLRHCALRPYRKAEDIKRLKRGAAIPIAVLMPRVKLKKRLDIEKLVAGWIPRVMAAIEGQIRGVY